jgi:membrane protease YdiL (CAAX protease family)
LIAEELGWRGYLQNKINNKFSNIVTPIIIGVIWALWHYHFWISGTADVPILVFTYGCIAESYGYFIITKLSKDNVIPASILHFSGNLFFNLYLLNPNWNNGSIMPYIIVNILYSVYIAIFVYDQKRVKI